ncbi:MAG: hypothetical protein ACJ71W_14665 [Terriglobales bacterium]
MSAPVPVPNAASTQSPPPTTVQDPITGRARMNASAYKASVYFSKDNPGFGFRVFLGFVLVMFCGVFSIPWSLRNHPPHFAWTLDGVLELVHYLAAWGALPIFFLMFGAIAYTRRALADFGVNIAIAQHVERSAVAKLLAIRNNPKMRGSVANLQGEHLPDNSSDPKPAAYRLFQRICAEAQDRRFESTINLIEPYQRESMEPVLKLEGVQKTSLRWGILCHFIGLVLVINSIPALLHSKPSSNRPVQAIASLGAPAEASSDSSTREDPIDKILDGLRLAFGASVGGLAVSIFAGWMLGQVRRKQFFYFRKLDEATAAMISLASNSLNNDELLVSLSQISRRLEEQTGVFHEGVASVAAAIHGQAKTMEEALKNLGESKTKLDEFLKGISDSHREFLQRLNTYYDPGTIGGVASQIKAQIENSQTQTVKQVSTEVRDLRKFISTMPENPTRAGSPMEKYLPYAVLTIAGAAILILITLVVR